MFTDTLQTIAVVVILIISLTIAVLFVTNPSGDFKRVIGTETCEDFDGMCVPDEGKDPCASLSGNYELLQNDKYYCVSLDKACCIPF